MQLVDEQQVTSEVEVAARVLVAAFSNFDRDAYFGCFAPDADFIFYNAPSTFQSRTQYEDAWDEWVSDGWSVRSCESVNPRIRVLDRDHAIFTHEVSTTLNTSDGESDMRERETIVFVRQEGLWFAVHEHLSPLPTASN